MGSGASCRSTRNSKSARVVLLGLDSSGKTTFLYKLAIGETVKTIPTIGFNVESVRHKRMTFVIWDIGGQDKLRPLWKDYTQNTTGGLLFFVDSADHERMEFAEKELFNLVEILDESMPIIVVANKKDLPGSLSCQEIGKRLNVDRYRTERVIHVKETCSTDGTGISDVMDLLEKMLKR